jgi:TatD DNase family protein
MIDTHCHLEMSAFDGDRNDVIKRALDAGLEAFINIGSDFEGNEGAVALSEKYDLIYAAVGIHPHSAKDFNEKVFCQLKEWAGGPGGKQEARCNTGEIPSTSSKVIAIGEVGLDYHYHYSPGEVQRAVFRQQLDYAGEIGLPVIVHSREADEDTIKILEDSGVKRGVMHCFSGDERMAEKVLAMGFHISVAGPVTFKKSSQLREVAKMIPDEFLLVETDAPFLAPEPVRGKRNEPAFVMHTARFLAELRGISLDDIDRITTVNAKRLFHIGELPSGQIAYKIRDSLYLNITNRCTSRCIFCVRFTTSFVKGHNLRIAHEPSVNELMESIGDPAIYKEIVFCGYGEPLLRLDEVKAVAAWVKARGGRIRINTNGHGNLIHKRNIVPELQGLVDAISISLDAQDDETYQRLCKPAFENAFQEVVDFIRESKRFIPEVQATVVEMDGVDVDKCKALADELGVTLRVRKLDRVG